jgi:hypothetical protein
VANKVISNIKIADLPANASTKARGSIRKWRADATSGGHEKDRKRKLGECTTEQKLSAPVRPRTPPGDGAWGKRNDWQLAKEASCMVAKMLDSAKKKLRDDGQERSRGGKGDESNK